ncbi:hypothetical protein Csa_001524 [Cucumis sativus]|uniref:Uncharacterized protein n=1 Tax=Cucumis sativus TaxID=3659 RepID=A0A0A0LIH6_CUCSA|nr:hypothetical protein Csa_001524 [Cucumis sativus]
MPSKVKPQETISKFPQFKKSNGLSGNGKFSSTHHIYHSNKTKSERQRELLPRLLAGFEEEDEGRGQGGKVGEKT